MKQLLVDIWRNNNFLSILGNVAFAGVAFISFAFLARSYSTSTFGEYMLFITGGTFLEMFRFGLTRTSVVKFLAGAQQGQQEAYIGANYLIGFGATIGINMLMWIAWLLFEEPIRSTGFGLFFLWYPFMALANLPMNNAISLVQAYSRFDRLLVIRAIASLLFLGYVVTNFWVYSFSITTTIVVQITTQLVTSLCCMVLGWDGLRSIVRSTKATMLELLHFGKFSMGTLLSTSLLKSADTFILGLMPVLGVSAVAVYSIPLKLAELLEIPLRSFVATLFPRLAKASSANNSDQVVGLFHDYLGMLTFIFIPILLLGEIFAPQLVLLFGGSQYHEAILIFRIYLLYGLFLPLDRLTGVALDSIGQPRYNLYKVLAMASVNIVGDIAAILIFESLEAIAIVTVINTFIGAYLGSLFLRRHLFLSLRLAAVRGFYFVNNKYQEVYGYLSK